MENIQKRAVGRAVSVWPSCRCAVLAWPSDSSLSIVSEPWRNKLDKASKLCFCQVSRHDCGRSLLRDYQRPLRVRGKRKVEIERKSGVSHASVGVRDACHVTMQVLCHTIGGQRPPAWRFVQDGLKRKGS